MDKIAKALKRLSAKEKEVIKKILSQIIAGVFAGLDIKKLKDHEDIFRVRKGSLRVIYQIKKEEVFVLAIERRSEKTYRDF